MIGWIILGLYAAGWLSCTVIVGRMMQEGDQKEHGVERAERYRWINLAGGATAGMMWPLTFAGLLVYYALRGPAKALMMTPLDREHAERQELERLREQARALGLPYPGEDR